MMLRISTKHVSTTILALMNGLEWLSLMLPEIQQLVVFWMQSLFMFSVVELNSLQKKSLMSARPMTSKKTSGKSSTSAINNLGYRVILLCVTKQVQHPFLFLVVLIDKIELMLVLCIIRVQIVSQSKEAPTYQPLGPSAQWYFKLKMLSIQ